MPLISLIMPVYNSGDYLEDTLASVLNQSFDDFELVCVNDGSSDGSIDILRKFAENDSRIKIVSQENSGSGVSRNRGLKESSGEYVFFIDSDDYIDPDFLRICYESISEDDFDFIMFQVASIRDDIKDDDVMFTPYHLNEKFIFNYEVNKGGVLNSYFAPWSKFYRKEFLTEKDIYFDENLPYEDVIFHIKSMIKAMKILFIPECIYYYRLDNPGSLSTNFSSHIKIFDVIESVREFLIDENLLNYFEKEFESFKIEQVLLHLSFPIDEEYYLKAKSYLDGIDYQSNDKIKEFIRELYEIFISCPSMEICQRNLKIAHLKKENEQLTRKRDYHKRIKEEIESSNSWKLTNSLRNFGRKFR